MYLYIKLYFYLDAQTDNNILFPNIPPVMIWFLLPSDVYNELKDNKYPIPTTLINVNYKINKRKIRKEEEKEESSHSIYILYFFLTE